MKNICDWNNCKKEGEFKAPIERDNSKKFRLLCLEHIKEFNKNWNYFNGMSCLLYTSPSPRDGLLSRMPSSA